MITVQNKKLAGKTLIVSNDISDTGQITLDAQGKIELENEKAQLLSESEGFELQIVEQAQPKMLAAVIVSNGTQAPSTINIISNTTGYNFTVQRSDVGVIDLISDTPCFHTVPHHNFTCLIHPNSETDFLGSQIGFSPHTQNILHINMLHPAITQEGYADIPGDIHINIIFKD